MDPTSKRAIRMAACYSILTCEIERQLAEVDPAKPAMESMQSIRQHVLNMADAMLDTGDIDTALYQQINEQISTLNMLRSDVGIEELSESERVTTEARRLLTLMTELQLDVGPHLQQYTDAANAVNTAIESLTNDQDVLQVVSDVVQAYEVG